ncbi:hypothetical protein GQX74_004647 [Glossina fuscipes]|nr:hypothetical protein GQX74_004647 [Glossina fuscipes]
MIVGSLEELFASAKPIDETERLIGRVLAVLRSDNSLHCTLHFETTRVDLRNYCECVGYPSRLIFYYLQLIVSPLDVASRLRKHIVFHLEVIFGTWEAPSSVWSSMSLISLNVEMNSVLSAGNLV